MDPHETDDRNLRTPLKPGTRLVSQVCTTEVVVVRAPEQPVTLCCGGHPMVPVGRPASGAALDPGHASGSEIGKRYGDEQLGIQVLCSHAGEGSLSVDSTTLRQVDTKSLPSSD